MNTCLPRANETRTTARLPIGRLRVLPHAVLPVLVSLIHEQELAWVAVSAAHLGSEVVDLGGHSISCSTFQHFV